MPDASAVPREPGGGRLKSNRKQIGEILIEEGWIDADQRDEALEHQLSNGGRLGEALIELGYLDEARLARGLGRQHGLPFVDLARGVIPSDVIGLIGSEVAAEFRIVPVKAKGRQLFVAVDDPLQVVQLDSLRFLVNKEIKAAICTPSALRDSLARYYEVEDDAQEADQESLAQAAEEAGADDAPIIRLVTKIIEDAVRAQLWPMLRHAWLKTRGLIKNGCMPGSRTVLE